MRIAVALIALASCSHTISNAGTFVENINVVDNALVVSSCELQLEVDHHEVANALLRGLPGQPGTTSDVTTPNCSTSRQPIPNAVVEVTP